MDDLGITVVFIWQMWMWILISLNIISKLHGYSGGYFPEACDSMLPDHNGAAPQTTKPPFMVEYVPGSYPGEPVTGTGNPVVFILLNLFITAMSGVIIIYFFFFTSYYNLSSFSFPQIFARINFWNNFQVLLKSEESTYFRGFMLEAREVADETRLTGRFVLLEPDKTQLLTCGVLEVSSWNLIYCFHFL